jgi:hypothetical protein
VNKAASIEDAEIEFKLLAAYAKVARRCRDDKDFEFARFPYEQGPGLTHSRVGTSSTASGQSVAGWKYMQA